MSLLKNIVLCTCCLLVGCLSADIRAPVENLSIPYDPKAGKIIEHVVRKNETLYSISLTYDIDVRELRSWNKLTDDTIKLGQRLRLQPIPQIKTTKTKPLDNVKPVAPSTKPLASTPPSFSKNHWVKKGETLLGIARRYQMEWRELARLNGLKEPYSIHPDQLLHLITSKLNTIATTNPPPKQLKDEPWQWPVKGKIIKQFSLKKPINKGINIAAAEGTIVHAVRSGEVVFTGDQLIGLGRVIMLRHDGSWLSVYAHNRAFLVKQGERVNAGQPIAEIGSSGIDSPQLHFEIRHAGKPKNPEKLLKGAR